MIFASSLLVLALQVGPNSAGPDALAPADELLNRPPRSVGEDAPTNPVSAWLSQCLDLVESDPARAHAQAQIKRNETAGPERVLANHCLGLAATELVLWDDAVDAFNAARDETPGEELRTRARFGTMAGNAALAAGYTGRALALLETAKVDASGSASAPLQAIAASDLARALVAQERPEDALAELEIATALAPESPDNWLLKATLLRRLDRLDAAQQAIERAVDLAPTEPQVGLEAGVIAVLSGREDAARQSWQSVIDINPDSPAALVAQEYLAQLSAGE